MDRVRVRITNVDTGVSTETFSNAVGVYRLVAVEPGKYVVEYSFQGFETKQVQNVVVTATQEVVLNQSLEVATATTSVEVVEATLAVDLSKSTATIERKLGKGILEIVPLTAATRNVNVLALLAPTASRAPGSTEVSANGQRARNNNFLIDGVDNNDPSVTIANNRAIPEAISEFQVQTQAYSAEFGRNSGAQIAVTTRAGANRVSGEVFDYYRANWMEPVSLLNKRNGLTATPRFNQNQAGGAMGGPIVKNRAFYFGLIEANRRREAPDSRNATSATIPTPAGYAALQNVPLGQGQTAQSRQAVLDGIAFLQDVHKAVGRYTNLRTVPVNNVPIEVGTINLPLANPSDFWYGVARTDFVLSGKDNLSYRVHFDKRNQPDVVSNLRFGNRFSCAQTIYRQNHALSHTRTFSPRFVNEFRFAYIRGNLDFPENDPVTPTTSVGAFFVIGGLNNFPQGRIQNTFQWQDVATYLAGRHSLKFGADIRRNRLYNRAAFDSKGTYTFDSLEDYVNNRAALLRQAVNTATFDARQTSQFYFFQDDFKVTKNLTLNLGMRYELSGVPFGFFGATDAESLAAGVPPPVKKDTSNWAPRLGVAFSPGVQDGFLRKLFGDGQTVFRGGYGMAYDVLFYNILTVNASNWPRVQVREIDRTGLANAWPSLLPGGALPSFSPRATYVNSPADTQAPATHFYSFSIQRQFLQSYIFEVGYSGARSYHGIRQGNTNPGMLTPEQAALVRATGNPNAIPGLPGVDGPASRRLVPAWGSRVSIEATALGVYNSIYLKFDKRLSQGLQVGANYTFGANHSDNDESLGVADITNSSPQIPQDFFNYRPEWSRSAFDVPHRVAFYYSYQIPWFAGGGSVLRHIFADWIVSGYTDFQSGQPFTVRSSVDTGGTGTPGPHRPDWNPSGTFTKDPDTGNLRTFATSLRVDPAFLTPLTAAGVPLANSVAGGGNLGRNTFRGPGDNLWNLSLLKNINITERWKVQLRGDFINLWNHRNFGNPVATMNSPIFGQNTTDPGGRTMLLCAKIRF